MSWDLLPAVVITAILTSAFTLGGAFLVIRFWLWGWFERELDNRLLEAEKDFREELEKTAEELIPEFRKELSEGFQESAEELLPDFRREVSEGFEEAARELLPEFRSEVKEGFEESARELLPEFRSEVQEGFEEGAARVLPEFRNEVKGGFEDAMISAAGGELVDRTAQKVASQGSRFVASGLNLIFGKPGQRKDEPK